MADLRVGDRVTLSEAGKRLLGPMRALRRIEGVVLNEARFAECWRIEWSRLTTPEVLHRSNLLSCEPTHG